MSTFRIILPLRPHICEGFFTYFTAKAIKKVGNDKKYVSRLVMLQRWKQTMISDCFLIKVVEHQGRNSKSKLGTSIVPHNLTVASTAPDPVGAKSTGGLKTWLGKFM